MDSTKFEEYAIHEVCAVADMMGIDSFDLLCRVYAEMERSGIPLYGLVGDYKTLKQVSKCSILSVIATVPYLAVKFEFALAKLSDKEVKKNAEN